jgi:hypothetical protein
MPIHVNLGLLGLTLVILGIIAGVNTVVELLFTNPLFTTFLNVIPVFLQSVFPNDPEVLRFAIRAKGNLYNSWDIAIIYLVLMPVVSMLFTGCWLFLILALLGVFNIGTVWLIIWFVVTALIYLVSAKDQYTIEIVSADRRLRSKGVKNRMLADPIKTMQRVSIQFVINWVRTPLAALGILLTVLLFVLIYWPAWLIKIIPAFRFDLSDKQVRTRYYAFYALIFGIAGAVLAYIVR